MQFSKEWQNILNEVAKFQYDKPFVWCRGQTNKEFKLHSGLYRNRGTAEDSYIATEATYYNVYKRLGYVYHNENDWNLLYTMQHHGVKTRLLDWTESFAVALFFASLEWINPKYNNTKNDISIFLLDPLALNDLTLKEKRYYVPEYEYEEYIKSDSKINFYKNSLALYPVRSNSRILAQQGMFTLQGSANIPLEEEFEGKLEEKGILKKIVISSNLQKDVERYFRQTGISHFSLFPDLEGLAAYTNSLGYFRSRDTYDL